MYRKFKRQCWMKYPTFYKMLLLQDFIKSFCKQHNMPIPKLKFEDMISDGTAYYKENIIVLNAKYLCLNLFVRYQKEIGLECILSLYHELIHCKQYYEYQKSICSEAFKINYSDVTKEIFINNEKHNISFLIESDYINNRLYKAVYILQPIEFDAYFGTNEKYKEIVQEVGTFAYQNNIKWAIEIIHSYFHCKDPVTEIQNAMMNLWDNGNRPCSEDIFDLVKRCAACSVPKEYGVDKSIYLLGNAYQESLLQKYKEIEKQEYTDN